MSKHIRMPGTVGIFDAKGLPYLPKDSYTVRGREGFMYAITFEPDDDVLAISLHQLMENGRKIELGPLVSRRRVEPALVAFKELLAEREIDLVPQDEITDQDHVVDDDGITDGDLRKQVEVVLRRTIEELAGRVGHSPGKHTIILGTGGKAKAQLTAAQILDAVWLDDEWEASPADVVTRATARGYALSEDAAKMALRRGPYLVAKEGAGRRSATWRRDVPKGLEGDPTDLTTDNPTEDAE